MKARCKEVYHLEGRSIIDDLKEKMLQKHKEDPFWSIFGLKESPFQVADNIDAKYFYESPNHKELINKLHSYIIHEAAYIYAVTGLAGVGKTFTYNVFANRFIAQQEEFRRLMREEGYTQEQISLVPVYQTMRFQNTTYGQAGEQVNVPMIKKFMLQQLNPELKPLLENLDVYHNPHHKERVHNLWNEAMVNLSRRNRVLILFIDEAQGLDLDIIRSIRLMTGINETMLKHVLTVVFIGTTDLMEKMNADDAIKSRLNEHFLLRPLDRKETGEMIRFRLSVASKIHDMANLIPDDVIDLLFTLTDGIPRAIFQKLSAAFRMLREWHVNDNPRVDYIEIENVRYPTLTIEVLKELEPGILQVKETNKELTFAQISKLSDTDLIEYIIAQVENKSGPLQMKISQNAWKDIIYYFRNQIIDIEEVIQDMASEASMLSSRYTISQVQRLVKQKVGETSGY